MGCGESDSAPVRHVGRTIQLSGRQYKVVGVMPAGLQYPDDAKRWLPLAPVGLYEEIMESRRAHWLHVIGRLRADSTERRKVKWTRSPASSSGQYPDASGG